ncbi:hypothetical protein [Caballeronia zhejiangensis]|uniref:hypothetical protein n=1 Tax=Caballeronia zhejiangensis TaxID=871203 RepID=UPI00052ED6DE|nr:hypothetical protein [Caballeronia zhejiangensis]
MQFGLGTVEVQADNRRNSFDSYAGQRTKLIEQILGIEVRRPEHSRQNSLIVISSGHHAHTEKGSETEEPAMLLQVFLRGPLSTENFGFVPTCQVRGINRGMPAGKDIQLG